MTHDAPLRILVALADPEEADVVAADLGRPGATEPRLEMTLAHSADEALAQLAPPVGPPDLVVIDPSLPGATGMNVLADVRARAARADIVVLSARADGEDLYEVVRLGNIRRYLVRPWSPTHRDETRGVLAQLVANRAERERAAALASESERLQRTNAALREQIRRSLEWDRLIAISPAMRACVERARALAGSRGDVCIVGAPGSGRAQLARAIHFQGVTAAGPLVSFHTLLFRAGGLASGAGEVPGLDAAAELDRRWGQARGGTLVIEDLEELDEALQRALARAVAASADDRPRLVVTSSDRPAALVGIGLIEPAVANALADGVVAVPSLAERREDLPALARALAGQLSADYSGRGARLSEQALAELACRRIPGGLPELEALLERAVAEAPGEVIVRLPPPTG